MTSNRTTPGSLRLFRAFSFVSATNWSKDSGLTRRCTTTATIEEKFTTKAQRAQRKVISLEFGLPNTDHFFAPFVPLSGICFQSSSPEDVFGATCASTETNEPQSIATKSGLVFANLSNFNLPTLAGLLIKIDFLNAFLLDQLEPIRLIQISNVSIHSRLFDRNCLSYDSSRRHNRGDRGVYCHSLLSHDRAGRLEVEHLVVRVSAHGYFVYSILVLVYPGNSRVVRDIRLANNRSTHRLR